MSGLIVERVIPAQYLEGIKTRQYRVGGGVIRDAANRKIVAHLQFADEKTLGRAARQVESLRSLQAATVALQGINLAVSVAGFAVVCKKLDRTAQQVAQLDDRVRQILHELREAEWKAELDRRCRWHANLENLAAGLRTSDQAGVSHARNELRASAHFYQNLGAQVCRDARNAFREAGFVEGLLSMVPATHLAIAHSYAHQGHIDEAIHEVCQLKQWQGERLDVLERPMLRTPPSLWLGLPAYQENKTEWQTLIRSQRAIPEGLEYTEGNYLLCKEEGLSL